MSKTSDTSTLARWSGWLAVLSLTVFGLLVYRKAFDAGTILLSTDDSIGAIALRKAAMPESLFGWWNDNVLLGVQEFLNITWTNLLLLLLSPEAFVDFIHLLDLSLGSVALVLFFRARGVAAAGAVLGALTTCWLGSTFFLTYAGHIGKFGAVFFACLSVWQFETALQRRSVCRAILGGGALGAMFLEQADSALFFALAIGSWVLVRCVLDRAAGRAPWFKVFAPSMLVAAMVAIHPVWMGKTQFGSAVPGSLQKDPNAQWEYCTQWSWPPDETIEWVAPGYMGWRSGEEAGPYWGRLGRSAGWEQTRQGFMNFKLETFYLGSIPCLLAFLGITLACSRRFGGENRADLIFWTVAASATFLLGLGKFFPLYKAFFALPGVSSIRNPVKFMQVTQLAMGVLAAHGLDAVLRRDPKEGASSVPPGFRWFALGFGLLLLLSAFAAVTGQAGKVQQMAMSGWGQFAAVIVSNQVTALLRAAVLALAAWAFIQFAPKLPRARAGILAAALLAVVMIDQLLVSSHYVKTVRTADLVGRNMVTDALKPATGSGQRAYVVAQDGFYNQWLTYLFPYHGIATFNVTQMRMPDDYQRYLGTLQRQPDRLWRLSGVGQLVGPAQIFSQLETLPDLRGQIQPGTFFNVAGSGGGVAVVPPQPGQRGEHVVATITAPAPRYALLAGWKTLADDATLAELANPAVPLLALLHVAPESSAGLAISTGAGITGQVDVVQYRPGAVALKTRSDVPTVLRAAERFTHDWKARVDGQPADLLRVDFMLQGVALPAGEHRVDLTYSPSSTTLKLQFAGMALCLLALLGMPIERRLARN